jgi:hypothetical protein
MHPTFDRTIQCKLLFPRDIPNKFRREIFMVLQLTVPILNIMNMLINTEQSINRRNNLRKGYLFRNRLKIILFALVTLVTVNSPRWLKNQGKVWKKHG